MTVAPKKTATKTRVKKTVNKEIPRTKCTMCGEMKRDVEDYYKSNSEIFKSNNDSRMCICKDCVGILFDNFKKRYDADITAIYEMCRTLDVYFSKKVYEIAVEQSEKTNSTISGIYFQKVNSLPQWSDKTFEQSDKLTQEDENVDKYDSDEDLTLFWGNGFTFEDYKFLEVELASWKSTHKCDNRAEEVLLREICIKILEIRKLREDKLPTSKDQKDLQDLMKTASVDPAKANIASAGKSVDAYGVWIKDIEDYSPAEWYADQEKYKDSDGFLPYIKKFFVRSAKNFLTGSKDFQVDAIEKQSKEKDGDE